MPNRLRIIFQTATLALSVGGSVLMAETEAHQPTTPNMTDLRSYLACNAVAEARPLSFEEASTCSVAFERLKLSFVSNMSFDQFNNLPIRQRADLSVRGYKGLRNWLEAHSTEVQRLKKDIRRGRALSMN